MIKQQHDMLQCATVVQRKYFVCCRRFTIASSTKGKLPALMWMLSIGRLGSWDSAWSKRSDRHLVTLYCQVKADLKGNRCPGPVLAASQMIRK